MTGRRWRRRTGHSVEGLQWGERKDVRGSICQPLSRVPAGFYLRLAAYCLLLNIPPAAVDRSYVPIWLIEGPCVHKHLTVKRLKSTYESTDTKCLVTGNRNIIIIIIWSIDGIIRLVKIQILEEKPAPVPLSPTQNPHKEVRDRTMASMWTADMRVRRNPYTTEVQKLGYLRADQNTTLEQGFEKQKVIVWIRFDLIGVSCNGGLWEICNGSCGLNKNAEFTD